MSWEVPRRKRGLDFQRGGIPKILGLGMEIGKWGTGGNVRWRGLRREGDGEEG